MHEGFRPAPVRVAGRLARLVAIAGLAALVVLGLTAGTALAKEKPPKPVKTTWLCKPGMPDNPCKAPFESTAINGKLEQSLDPKAKTGKTPINCFYVYPTVSEQLTANANLAIEAQQTQIAIDQASRFSQDCRVFAPVYPQFTIAALNTPGAITPEVALKAYLPVRVAFEEFISKYDKGRGFVLLGHSQGSLQLTQLIREVIDPNEALRSKLVSAVLLGGNIVVPEGQLVGGSFQHVPLCSAAAQTGCVIAYSSFFGEPPAISLFGRTSSPLTGPGLPGTEIACVNPTLLTQNGGSGALEHYESTTAFPGILGLFSGPPPVSSFGTPWVRLPAQYTAQCHKENGASWLQINPVGEGDERPGVQELLGAEWGLHLFDYNLALGNLVKTVKLQAATYAFEH
jgi:Protein of unknown function (DUF3089)